MNARERSSEIMGTFFTRWGYASSASSEQEEYITQALEDARTQALEEAAKVAEQQNLVNGSAYMAALAIRALIKKDGGV